MDFENDVKSYKSAGKAVLARCPDQYVGCLGDLSKHVGFTEGSRRETDFREQGRRCIILVLESPHKDEFQDGQAIGPAVGSTGRNIAEHLWDMPEFKPLAAETGVILMNAIQYQCSLGEPTWKCRDDVFRKLWSDRGYSVDFKTRLRKIIRAGDVVANCCTKGKKRKYLREMVHESIVEVLDERKNVPLYGRAHPCSWWSPRVRQASPWYSRSAI